MRIVRRLLMPATYHRPAGRQRSKISNMKGFTIVETLIVLAIAGIILMIVFEAIPTLERDSRNNQRRQDVQTILEAVSHYELNDSGNFPDNCGTLLTPCTNTEPLPQKPNDYFLSVYKNKLTYYLTNGSSGTSVRLTSQSAGGASRSVTNPDVVQVYDYYKCDPNNQGYSTSTGAGFNNVVALYAIEAGPAHNVPQCQQL